jgi:hypothetical protein
VKPVSVRDASVITIGVVRASTAKANATRKSTRRSEGLGHGLSSGKTVANARKETGIKLELTKARRDHSSTEDPV